MMWEILENKRKLQRNNKFKDSNIKIIKKSRFKFLKQKDGIEEDFLLQYGVNDLSIDSLEEIPNYIIRKYERIAFKEKDKSEEIKNEDLLLDNELANLLESKEQENSQNLTSSILEEPVGININELDNLIELESSDKEKLDTNYISMEDFDENFGLNNVSFDYDDDSTFNQDLKSDEDLLQDILNSSIVDEDDYEFVGETFEDVNFLDEIFPNNKILDIDEKSITPINIVLQEKDKDIDLHNENDNSFDEIEALKDFNFDEEHAISQEIFCFLNGTKGIVSNVEDAAMEPTFKVGDIVAGELKQGDEIKKLLGLDCIVKLNDGTELVRKLEIDSNGQYVLMAKRKSMHPAVITNPDINSAAEVIWIRRRSSI